MGLFGRKSQGEPDDRLALGLQLAVSGRSAEAIGHLEAAVSAMEAEGRGEPEPLTTARAYLGDAYLAIGDALRAIPLMERVAADQKRVLGPEAEDTFKAFDALASGYWHAGHKAKAVSMMERQLADLERTFGIQHPMTKETRSHLGYLYLETGREHELDGLLERGPVPTMEEAGIEVVEYDPERP